MLACKCVKMKNGGGKDSPRPTTQLAGEAAFRLASSPEIVRTIWDGNQELKGRSNAPFPVSLPRRPNEETLIPARRRSLEKGVLIKRVHRPVYTVLISTFRDSFLLLVRSETLCSLLIAN